MKPAVQASQPICTFIFQAFAKDSNESLWLSLDRGSAYEGRTMQTTRAGCGGQVKQASDGGFASTHRSRWSLRYCSKPAAWEVLAWERRLQILVRLPTETSDARETLQESCLDCYWKLMTTPTT